MTAPCGRGSVSGYQCAPVASRDQRKRYLRLSTRPTRIAALAASLLGALLSAQTETLDRLFADRNYIELAAALHNSANLSPEQAAFYRGLLANRRNAAADSIINLEIALPALEAANDLAHLKVAYYILADDYSKTFRYADAASVYRKVERRFGASLPHQERQDVRDSLRKWEALSRAEPQTVRIEESFVINRTRDEAGILTVPVRFGMRRFPACWTLAQVTRCLRSL